jgi:hypothetical protein
MTPQTSADSARTSEVDRFRARFGVRALLAASFLLLIYGVPLTQAGLEFADGHLPRFLDIFIRPPTRANLRSYERELDDASLFAKASRPWVQYAWFKVFRYAGEKVVVGRDGWLFYKPDLDYLIQPSASGRDSAEDPIPTILDFRDQLAARGIRLMVIPLPGKPTIYADKLPHRGNGVLRSHTQDLASRLRQAGVETLDLLEMFANSGRNQSDGSSEALYLHRDTHWSGTAARMAAEGVAQRILDLGWTNPGEIPFDLVTVRVNRHGDLIRMIAAPALEWKFPDERTLCYQVVHHETRELYKDDPTSPVLILGDSFLRMYQTDEPRSAGFIAHLARSLQMPVASIVNDGGASTLVRQELARRAALLEGKKVALWEFVERDIAFGTEGWKKVRLPLDNRSVR